MNREVDLIKDAIKKFELNLDGMVVFTEAASGNYIWTTIIAALAKAKIVYAVTRDSKYGAANDVIKNTYDVIHSLGLNNVIIRKNKEVNDISETDIFTNLGFVRRIDKSMIERMKKGAVISLMWEPWEFREEDIDYIACREHGIPIIGINEEHRNLETVKYLGLTVVKLLLEYNLEILRNKFVVIGSGIFLIETSRVLTSLGAKLLIIDVDYCIKSGSIPNITGPIDAVICVEHYYRDQSLVGELGIINSKNIVSFGSSCKLFHICGNIDVSFVKRHGVFLIPDADMIRPPGYMSFTVDYIGPKPLIDLHTAGLKVGEIGCNLLRQGRNIDIINKEFDLCKLFTSYYPLRHSTI